ncbi:MAG: VWA domain-containing protein [Pyrinomonadaceae bacterium]
MCTRSGNLRFFALVLGLAVYAYPQQIEREFGWSLTVDPAKIKKEERRAAAAGPNGSDPGEIRVDTDLVLSDLLVQDRNGAPVTGLKVSDFEINEDGTPQTIDIFANGDSSIPRSIILVIDHSLSQLRHIDTSIESAKVLVDSMRPTDRMAVVSDDVEVIIDLTSDKQRLKEALEGLRIKCKGGKFGKSSQYSALFATLNEKISRNGTRNIVIFQTDGDELSLLRSKHSNGLTNFGLEDIASAAERKGVTVYTVFTGSRLAGRTKGERIEHIRHAIDAQIRAFAVASGKPPPMNQSSLSKDYILSRAERTLAEEKAVASVAEATGGIAQSLESPDQAFAVYDRILSDIGHRYLIGYYPPERSTTAARERKVLITLKNKANYRVIGGRTYVIY